MLEYIDELTKTNCATVTGTLNSVQVGEWYVVGLLGLWSKFMMTYKWFSWNRNNQEFFFKNKADYSSVKKQDLFYQLAEEPTWTTTRVVGLQN